MEADNHVLYGSFESEYITITRGDGVYVYDDDGLHELKIAAQSQSRDAELRELYDAVKLGKPVYHSGRWGMATLEVAMAINESTKTHKDVQLTHQVEMPASYDVDYKVEVEEEVLVPI